MQFYDTDLQSDHPPSDLMSDKDLPKEKLRRQKLLFKEEFFRVQKEFRERGEHYEKPAYFDRVQFQLVEISEDQYHHADERQLLDGAPIQEQHIERPEKNSWLDKALTSMKRGQIAIYIHEHLKRDNNDLKVLEKIRYFLVRMVDWTVFIDMDQDMSFLKQLLRKGVRGDRCEYQDEIDVEVTIKHGEAEVYALKTAGPKIMKNVIANKVVAKILKTMKSTEHALTVVKNDAYRSLEPSPEVEGDMDWVVEINLKQLCKIDDLYHDGQIIKKTLYKGRSTAKPDKISQVDFDLWIYSMTEKEVPEELLFSSATYEPPFQYKKIKKPQEDNDLQIKLGTLQLYIDDLEVSKLMRKALTRMKKNELAIIKCFDTTGLITNGVDYEGLKGIIPKQLIYIIHVFDFSEGKTNFSMSVDEKIEQAVRKRQVGLKWISSNNFKKALNVFKTINAFFDYGTFTEEDKKNMRPQQISALLNTSLCYLKLQQWPMMKHVCEKLYKLDPENPKVVFRYATALKNLFQYEEALEVLKGRKEPENEEMRRSIAQLQQKYLKREQEMCKKMFE